MNRLGTIAEREQDAPGPCVVQTIYQQTQKRLAADQCQYLGLARRKCGLQTRSQPPREDHHFCP